MNNVAIEVTAKSYTHAKGARAAARNVLGKDAGEGKEYRIKVLDSGRFEWHAINVQEAPKVAEVTETPAEKDKRVIDNILDMVGGGNLPEAAEEPIEPPPSAAASAFGAFALGQLGAGPSTSTAKPTKTPVEKKVKLPPEIANGVRKPSVGTVCRAVWEELYKMQEANGGVPPDSKQVKQLAIDKNWNPNNCSIEFYQWRKFHGITGRAPKAA